MGSSHFLNFPLYHPPHNMFQSVYLDATFQPLLRRMDFLQEGHRLEFSPESSEVDNSNIVTETQIDTAVSVDGSTNIKAEANVGLSKAALGFKGTVES